MLLDEVRIMTQKKYDAIKDDADETAENKELAAFLIKFFQKEDAICETARSIVLSFLLFIGYEFDDIYKIYDDLMKELNQKYILIHPDMVQKNGEGNK